VIYMVIAGLLALGFKLFEQRFNRGMLG
jgi:polar amino acid transport system permease protein